MTLSERLIKKYPNRRLYDTHASAYITLSDIKRLVLANEKFMVVDAKTEEDLTRSILLQIILEEEANGAPMFSSNALAQIIRYYGNAMQGMMGTYLEKNIQAFIDIQNKMTENSKELYKNPQSRTEVFAQMIGMQNPLLQNLMGNYFEQNKKIFGQMQEQTHSLFNHFPFGVSQTQKAKTDDV